MVASVTFTRYRTSEFGRKCMSPHGLHSFLGHILMAPSHLTRTLFPKNPLSRSSQTCQLWPPQVHIGNACTTCVDDYGQCDKWHGEQTKASSIKAIFFLSRESS